MVATLRPKSQVTIPKQIIDNFGLTEGDKLEVFEENGRICLLPVVVYPKTYVDQLMQDVRELREKISTGEQQVYDSVDNMVL